MKKAKEEKENRVKYGTVSLPLPLIEKIKKRIKGTGIPSVSSYVAFVLRELLSDKSEKEANQRVKERLRMLGY